MEEVRKKDSARLIWSTKPRRAVNPRDIEFQTAEIVLPNPTRDQQTIPSFFNTLSNSQLEKNKMNRLIWGDNLLAMQALLASGYEGKIGLIYIDPPFWINEDYYAKFEVGNKEITKLPSIIERLAYMHNMVIQMYNTKLMMDEIFGNDNFRNEIIVKRGRKKGLMYQFEKVDRMHTSNDSILWYTKSSVSKFKHPLSQTEGVEAKWMGFWSNVDRPTMRYELFGVTPNRGQWKWKWQVQQLINQWQRLQ